MDTMQVEIDNNGKKLTVEAVPTCSPYFAITPMYGVSLAESKPTITHLPTGARIGMVSCGTVRAGRKQAGALSGLPIDWTQASVGYYLEAFMRGPDWMKRLLNAIRYNK